MKVQILEAELHYIHGTVQLIHGFALPLARGVGLRKHDTDDTILVLADGVDGYQLERDMVGNTTAADQQSRLLETVLPVNDFARPYVEGATVSARRVTRMQLEGADVLLTSGTGLLSSATAIGARLGYKDGRLRLAQTGDEHVFTVRHQLPAEDSSNTFRLEVAREANPVI